MRNMIGFIGGITIFSGFVIAIYSLFSVPVLTPITVWLITHGAPKWVSIAIPVVFTLLLLYLIGKWIQSNWYYEIRAMEEEQNSKSMRKRLERINSQSINGKIR